MTISCIMPTWNRREFIPSALACFRSQIWEDRELVVLDDGEDPVEDLLAGQPGVLYLRHRGGKLRIGVKRNLCCEAARGDVICHWDDDDWSSPMRLYEQAELMALYDKALVGFCRVFYWSVLKRKAFLYNGPDNYAVGSSFMYRKEFWKRHPFPELAYAEDHSFVRFAQDEKQIRATDGTQTLVVRAHARMSGENSERFERSNFPEVAIDKLPAAFLQFENAMSQAHG